MSVEIAVQDFLECLEKNHDPEVVAKDWKRLAEMFSDNLLVELVTSLTGDEDFDDRYVRCLYWALLVTSSCEKYNDKVREAAETFIEKCDQKHPVHWASVAACFALLNDDYPVRLAAFAFSPQFLASAFTHLTILSNRECLAHFEAGLTSVVRDLQRTGSQLVLQSLIKTIDVEKTVGCLADFFGEKSKSRSLMEVVKFGASRKRNRDGTFVVTQADENLRTAVMHLVKAICSVSPSLFHAYILSWDGPTDSAEWHAVLVSLFQAHPSFFPKFVEHVAPRTRQRSEDWWIHASQIADIVDTCKTNLDVPVWFDAAIDKEMSANGDKSVDALKILSKISSKFTTSRWKSFDVGAVCKLLFRLGITEQLRLVSSLVSVVRFPEILAKSVTSNAVLHGETLVSDVDRLSFAKTYLNLVQCLLDRRLFYDGYSLRYLVGFVLDWKSVRPEEENHHFDVSLAGFLADVDDIDAFGGLARFCIALKDSETLDDFDRLATAQFTVARYSELYLERDGPCAWLSVLNFVEKLHNLDTTNKAKLSKVLKFIVQSEVQRNVKEIVLRAIASRLRGTAIDLRLTVDLVACWRQFRPSALNFFEAIDRWPSPSELESLVMPRKGKFVEFLRECVEIEVEKGKAIFPVVARLAPKEVSVAAVRKCVSESVEWLCADFGWVEVVFSDHDDEPLPIDCLLALKTCLYPVKSDERNVNFWRLVGVFFSADILSDEEVQRIHELASKNACEELKELSAFASLVSAVVTPTERANLTRIKKYLNTHQSEGGRLFQRALHLLTKRRKAETKYLVCQIRKVGDHERAGDILFDWLLSGEERSESDETIVLRLLQCCSKLGKLELFSSNETVWRWVERWNSNKSLSKPVQRLTIILMIHIADNTVDEEELDHLRGWLTPGNASDYYRGTLDVTEQLMVKLLAAVEKENFSQHDNVLVDSLKAKLWALVDAEDAKPMRMIRHVCKTHTKVVGAVKIAPSFDVRRGGIYRDGKADSFDPRMFTFALLAMFREIEEEYRPRYSVRAFVSLGFPAVAVACLSSRDVEVRLAATCVLRHLVEVVSNFKTSSILVKMWNDFCTILLNTLAAESNGGERLQPALPPAWTAFLSAGCLTFNDASSQLHKAVTAFLFRSGHIKGCWSSFLPFLRFYNSLDVLGGKEKRTVCRKFVLDVCRRAAIDSSTFEKEHMLKIMLGSFSVTGRGPEPEDLLSTVKLILERNITKRPTIMRSILDWGIALLLENIPRNDEAKPNPAAVSFASLFGEILWCTWKSFLYGFLSALNFNLESSSAASESELFVDFALASSLVAAVTGSDAAFTLERRLACVALEESLGLDVKKFVDFPPARATWQKRYSADFGSGSVDRDLALERRLLIFTRNPETWENFGLEERCALQCALFGC